MIGHRDPMDRLVRRVPVTRAVGLQPFVERAHRSPPVPRRWSDVAAPTRRPNSHSRSHPVERTQPANALNSAAFAALTPHVGDALARPAHVSRPRRCRETTPPDPANPRARSARRRPSTPSWRRRRGSSPRAASTRSTTNQIAELAGRQHRLALPVLPEQTGDPRRADRSPLASRRSPRLVAKHRRLRRPADRRRCCARSSRSSSRPTRSTSTCTGCSSTSFRTPAASSSARARSAA